MDDVGWKWFYWTMLLGAGQSSAATSLLLTHKNKPDAFDYYFLSGQDMLRLLASGNYLLMAPILCFMSLVLE